MIRQVAAVGIGLALPLALFLAVLTAASHGTNAELVVERIADPREAIGARVIGAVETSVFPPLLRNALHQAAREGSATVRMSGGVEAMWEQLTAAGGGATRFLCELDGVLLLLEGPAKKSLGLDDAFARAAAGVHAVAERVGGR